MKSRLYWLVPAVLALVSLGCASVQPEVTETLAETDRTALALDGARSEFRVSVSPAGDTLSMIPRVGRALGTGVDVVVNERYRVAFREALGDYNPGVLLQDQMMAAFTETLGAPPATVSPLSSTAGYQTRREAESDWLEGLAKKGYGIVFDIQADYGLYESQVELRFALGGKAVDLRANKAVWRGDLEFTPGPLLADITFKNPLQRFVPYLNKPEFWAEGSALQTFQADEAAALRAAYEEVLAGGIEALFNDMGLRETAEGQRWLGRDAFRNKDWDQAAAYMERAGELSQGAAVDLRNDMSVVFARAGHLDEAIALAHTIIDGAPDHGPALYNLAYWLAVERNAPEDAREYYDRALAAGMAPSSKIDRALTKEY